MNNSKHKGKNRHQLETPPLPFNLLRMTSIWELANPQLREIAVYEPGRPIEETARELGIDSDGIIKLASNENPLGPSPNAVQAMRAALDNSHLYPDWSGFCLCKAIDRKSTRLNSSHEWSSYAVFCLKSKT